MRQVALVEQINVIGGTKYVCGSCGYEFGSIGIMVAMWGSVSTAKGMHEYFKHDNKTVKWTTK